MSKLPLATPVEGQLFSIDGQNYTTDATRYAHTVAFGVEVSAQGGGDDVEDFYQELFAELSSGAYGFPTTTAAGNLMFSARAITWFIVFNGSVIELREGAEAGTLRLTIT